MPLARHPSGETCPGSLPKYTSFFLPQEKSNSQYLEVLDTNKLTQSHSGAALLCFAHLYVQDRVSTYKCFPARSRKGNICWSNFTATTHRPSALAVELLHKKDLPKPLLMCSGRPAVNPACPYTMEITTWTVNTKLPTSSLPLEFEVTVCLRGVLSLKLLPHFLHLLCYSVLRLQRGRCMVVEDFSVLMSLPSAPSYHNMLS